MTTIGPWPSAATKASLVIAAATEAQRHPSLAVSPPLFELYASSRDNDGDGVAALSFAQELSFSSRLSSPSRAFSLSPLALATATATGAGSSTAQRSSFLSSSSVPSPSPSVLRFLLSSLLFPPRAPRSLSFPFSL
ncbi:hypothetical protein AAHE18_03G194100 [Arachis hypogaea]